MVNSNIYTVRYQSLQFFRFKNLVIQRVEKILKNSPDDIRYLEIKARLLATPGTWEDASHDYEKIYNIAPSYRDVAWQTVRSSIYSARWPTVGRILANNPELSKNIKLRKMYNDYNSKNKGIIKNANNVTI